MAKVTLRHFPVASSGNSNGPFKSKSIARLSPIGVNATEFSEDSLLAEIDSSEIFSVAVESEIAETSAITELLVVSVEESENSTDAEEALAEKEADESLDDPHAVSAEAVSTVASIRVTIFFFICVLLFEMYLMCRI